MSLRLRMLQQQNSLGRISNWRRSLSLTGFEWNSAWLAAARIALQVQTVLLTILVARHLGAAAFGQYSLIAALVFLGNVLTTFGTDTLLIRQVAQVGRVDLPEIRAVLYLQIAFSTLTVFAVWMWTLASPHSFSPQEALSLRLYALSLFPLAYFSVYSAILRGLERMDLALIAAVSTGVIQLSVVWLAFQAGTGLVGLMGVLLIVQVFAAILSYILYRMAAASHSFRSDSSKSEQKTDWHLPVQVLRLAWPLAALSILGVIYLRLGVFALSFLGSDIQTGVYSSAARVVEALKLGHIAVLGALLPALVRLQSRPEQTPEARRLFRRTVGGLLGLGMLAAAGTFLFAQPLVFLVFGARYASAILPLRILSWILIPYSLTSVFAVEMISKKREKDVTIALGLSLIAAAALNLWWIPVFGIVGACAAAVAAEIVQAGVLWGMRKMR